MYVGCPNLIPLIWKDRYISQEVEKCKKIVKLDNNSHKDFNKEYVRFHVEPLSRFEYVYPVAQLQPILRSISVVHVKQQVLLRL